MSHTPEDTKVVLQVLRSKNDFYAMLCITKTAGKDDIQRAYKKLAMRLHPDKNKHPQATEAFKHVASAKETLCDDAKRRAYDRGGVDGVREQEQREQGGGGGGGAYRRHAGGGYAYEATDIDDIFAAFFGMPRQRGQRRPGQQQQQRQQQQRQQQHANATEFAEMDLGNLTALLPFLLFVVVIFLMSAMPSLMDGNGHQNARYGHQGGRQASSPSYGGSAERRKSLYSMHRDSNQGFVHERVTTQTGNDFPDLKVSYFVRDSFDNSLLRYQIPVRSVEMEVLKSRKEYLQNKCKSDAIRERKRGRSEKPSSCAELEGFRRVG